MVTNETDEIERIVMEYVSGVVDFDFQRAENEWHKEGLKITFDKERTELVTETIIETRPDMSPDQIELMKSKICQKGNIESVDRTGKAANVKLVWLSERDGNLHEYTDYILLLNLENKWKIVAKVSDVRKVD